MLNINDDGTLRLVADLHINDDGTLREVKDAYINDNGTWRLAYSANSLIAVADFSASASAVSGSINAAVRIGSDGRIDKTSGSSSIVYYTDWNDPVGAGTGDDFEVEATLVSGTSPAGLSMNTAYALTSDRTWLMGRSSDGTSSGVIDITITNTTTSASETFRVTLSATIIGIIE